MSNWIGFLLGNDKYINYLKFKILIAINYQKHIIILVIQFLIVHYFI